MFARIAGQILSKITRQIIGDQQDAFAHLNTFDRLSSLTFLDVSVNRVHRWHPPVALGALAGPFLEIFFPVDQQRGGCNDERVLDVIVSFG